MEGKSEKQDFSEGPENVQDFENKENRESFDKILFEEFEDISRQKFGSLKVDIKNREEQKKLFLEDSIRNPKIEYTNRDHVYFEDEIELFEELQEKIEREEQNEVIKEIYHAKIDEQIELLKLHQATKEGDDEAYLEHSKALYGEPTMELFAYTLSEVKKEANTAWESGDEVRITAADRIQAEILNNGIAEQNTINPKDFGVPEYIPDQGGRIVTEEEVKESFLNALEEEGHLDEGWKVEIDNDEKRMQIGVNQSTKIVHIPHNKYIQHGRENPMTERELALITAHEVTHVRRSVNGEKSPLKLLGKGLDRYSGGEEAVAKLQEQKISGVKSFSRNLPYLSICLALGLDGKKRDFRDVYEIAKDYIAMTLGGEEGINDSETQNVAWKSTYRMFRGATGETPGVCSMKRIVYRQKNYELWKLLKENPEMEQYFMLGKYDPVNERHVELLRQLDIIPPK